MGGKPAGYSSRVRELISTEIGQKDPLLGQNAGGSNLNVGSRAKGTKNSGVSLFAALGFFCMVEDSSPSPLLPASNQLIMDLMLESTEDNLKIWPRCRCPQEYLKAGSCSATSSTASN